MKLQNITIDQILKTYDLPHRLLVYFSSQCAKDALSRIKDPDPRSSLAVDVAERFGNGEDFSQEYLHKVYDDAYASAAANAVANAATHAVANAYYAANAAHYAANANDASAAYYAANAAHYAANANDASAANAANAYATSSAAYKDLLLKLIDERLTPLEKLLILG